jgi:ABC-type lipoprotein export system ATPase subunit
MKTDQAFHRIKRIRVTGGFLMGLDLTFDGSLNCIIGPRGTGKSTVQEMIRFALKVMPGRDGDPIRKRVQSLINSNLNGGRVELTIETKDGLTYVVSRSSDEEPILLDEAGNPISIDAMVAQIFRADIFSQNQIESIAETPHYQLDLLDKFEEEALRNVRAQIAATGRNLETNGAAILPLLAEKGALEGEMVQLDTIQEKLKGFTKAGGEDAEKLNQAHALKSLRDRETRAMERAQNGLMQFAREIRGLVGSAEDRILGYFEDEMQTGPNGALITEVIAAARSGVERAEALLERAATALDSGAEGVFGQREGLEKLHAAQEMEFRKLVEKHQQDQALSAERTKLEKQLNELRFKQRRLAEIQVHIKELNTAREVLLARLSDDRDRRFSIRQSVAERLNQKLMPHIRVTIAQNADQDAFRRSLEASLRNVGINHKSVATTISSSISPQELGEYVRSGDAVNLAKSGGINPAQAANVIRALSSHDRLMELEIIDTDDLPSIELCDNGVYKNSAGLSTGQKCTAILPILLFDSANPLLIDQPEDNLDNSYVFNSVVASVTAVKEARQLIFVTHNPNIPVLGDAGQVIVMESDGRAGKVKQIGNVDVCRDEIINLLEGGEDAFRLRGERYHGVTA